MFMSSAKSRRSMMQRSLILAIAVLGMSAVTMAQSPDRPAEKRRYDGLRQRRDRRAAELNIDPTLIASRATLSSLARDWEKHQGSLMQWQRELLRE